MVFEKFGSVLKLSFQAVIKSAASAASLDLQGSPRTTARHADGGARGLPCKSREAALAADLITSSKFSFLLGPKKAKSIDFLVLVGSPHTRTMSCSLCIHKDGKISGPSAASFLGKGLHGNLQTS